MMDDQGMSHADGKELTIIGAGIVGICCALEAAGAGYKVTVIDRCPPGESASYGIAGTISPWSVVPQAMPGIWKNLPKWFLDPKGPAKVRWPDLPKTLPWVWSFFRLANERDALRISDAMAILTRDSPSSYAAYLKGTGYEDLLRQSHLVTVFRNERRPDLSDLSSNLKRRHGADMDVLSGDEVREVEPCLSKDVSHAVLTRNQARLMDPGMVCRVLAGKAENLGVRFLRHEVRSLAEHADGHYTLHTGDRPIPAERVLVCAGAWSSKLLKSLGVRTPLIGERGYHVVFSDPGVTVNHSIADAGAKIILSQMNAGVRIAGTAEFGDPDAPPNYRRAEALVPLAKRLLPALETQTAIQWMGVRPSFPDNLPVIDRIDGHANLFGAFGHSHYGFMMAPQTARLAVRKISGVTPNEEASCFAFSRF